MCIHTAGGALSPEIWEPDPFPCFPPDTPLHLSLFSLSASPRQESSRPPPPSAALSLPLSLQPSTHPRLPARLQRNAPLAGAALWSSEHPPRLQIGLSFLTPLSLSVDHGPLLHWALRLVSSAQVSKNIKAPGKIKRANGREGGRGYRQTDRDRDTPLSSSTTPLDLEHLAGRDTSSCVSADRDTKHASICLLHPQLYSETLLRFALIGFCEERITTETESRRQALALFIDWKDIFLSKICVLGTIWKSAEKVVSDSALDVFSLYAPTSLRLVIR